MVVTAAKVQTHEAMALRQYHQLGCHCGSAGCRGSGRRPVTRAIRSHCVLGNTYTGAYRARVALPAAATFHRYVSWQSNGSRCGPAAVANAYRSLGEAASTEGKVLAG